MKFLVSQKYQPISLKRWGDDHYVYDIHETESQIDIFLKSNIHKCQCPDCGVNSDSRHSTYDRVLQDVPFRDFKTTYLHVRAFTYNYNNFPTEKKGHGYERRADGSIAISRSAIFKYLLSLNPRTNDPGSSKCKDGKVGWWLKLLEKKYPVISLFRTVASEFYSVITGEEPEKVDEFIEKYGSEGKSKDKSSNNEKTHAQKILEGFCKGLKQDIEAVKNSIIYKDVSSGPVEGCNNKVKLIKRRGYGRNNLENLGKKCILGFADGIPGFSFKILVSTGKTERFVMHYKRRSKLSLIQITA